MISEFKKCNCIIITLIKFSLIKSLAFIITVLLIIMVPLILLVVILTFGVFRYLLHKSTHWIRPDLGKMVTLKSAVLALDKLYTNPLSNIVIQLSLEGMMDIEKLKVTVTRNLLEGKLPNGEIKYPELKQFLTSWFGYYFWTDDKTFDLNRHVTNMQTSNESDSEVQDILQKLLQKPWTRERPLWEIILLPKVEDNVTVMFFRYHHSLSDGHSILKLLTEGLSESIPRNAEPTFSTKNSFFKSLLFWVVFPFKCFYELAVDILEADFKVPLRPIFKLKDKGQEENISKFVVRVTDKISIQRIKEIKNHFSVEFASVINAVCTGTLRDIMISKGIKVPKVFPCGTVLPVPGHTEKLRNVMALAMMKFYTGEADPVKRLLLSSKDYQRLKRSALPLLTECLQIIVSLPACVVKLFVNSGGVNTSGLSNFPAGLEHMYFEGCKCIDVISSGGLISNSIGITFFALSYVDGIRISAVANDTVMTKEELKEVVQLLQKHVDILHEEIIKDV